jgi:outer membrane protein assembly factor BamB
MKTLARLLMALVGLSHVPCLLAAGHPTQTFDDPTITGSDEFGHSISIDGNRVLVGARRDNTYGDSVGQAHLLDATTGNLLRTFDDPVLTPTDQPLFGHSVALNGNTVLIGAPNDHSGLGTGQAHLFDADTGAFLRTFVDPTVTQFDQFGWSVALDDNYVAIGARGDGTVGSHVGQVHLFDAATGNLLQTFDDPTPLGDDNFGWSVAIDGDFVLIGAPSDSTSGLHVGQAHLFDAKTGSLLHTLDDPSITGADGFGYSVAIDEARLLIGARGDDVNGVDVGQAYLFDAVAGLPLKTFNDPTATGSDFFGYSVAIEGDNVLIGENRDGANAGGMGQAHRFSAATGELVGTFDSPTAASDGFGARVALDGQRLLVAALSDDANGTNVGRVYLYLVPEPSALRLIARGSLVLLLFPRPRRPRSSLRTMRCH